ncbi:MAG: hypothetical protein IPO25_21640 [Saprospiraceae bacterium]|nr:hypothetical protein [Saprospiraceae bacterium]
METKFILVAVIQPKLCTHEPSNHTFRSYAGPNAAPISPFSVNRFSDNTIELAEDFPGDQFAPSSPMTISAPNSTTKVSSDSKLPR